MQKQRKKTRVVDCWRSLRGAHPNGITNWPIVRPKFSIPLIWNKLTQDARKSGLYPFQFQTDVVPGDILERRH